MDLVGQIARLPKAHSPDGAVYSLHFSPEAALAKGGSSVTILSTVLATLFNQPHS